MGASTEKPEKEPELVKDEETETWSAFTQEVTMHGIKYVHLSNIQPLTKVLWLVTILIMIGYAAVASHGFFATYARQETTTKFRNIRSRELQFPTMLLCDRNSFTWWSLQSVMAQRNLTGLDILLKDLFSYGQVPLTPVNWSLPEYKQLFELTNKEIEDLIYELAPRPEHTISYASYNLKILNISAEFTRVITDFGLCYVFNSDGRHKADSSGIYSGLMLNLNAAVDGYYIGPGAVASGFTVALYKPGDIPLMANDGMIGIGPGSLSSIMLQLNKIKRQPPPADDGTADCYDTRTQPNYLSYYPQYTYNACLRECTTNYSVAKCGCRHIFDPAVAGTDVCKPDKLISCIHPLSYKNNSERTTYYEEVCHCKNTCEEEYYTTQIASYNFPNAKYFMDLYGYDQTTIGYMKENIAQFTLSYRSLSYNLLEEHLAYTWMDVIANLGGTLGVCIGASLLTICEFIQFGISSLVRCWSRVRQKRKTGSVIQVQAAPPHTY